MLKTILADVDLKKIARDSVQKQLGESYVFEPKAFKQSSDMISQKTKDGHTELYIKYVQETNRISAELDGVNKEETNSNHSNFRSLKLDETYNLNAKILHELYFANCFDPNSQIYMDSNAYMKLQRDFGTFDKWQTDFLACAESCGEGWVVCGYNIYVQKYVNTIVSNHSQDVMFGLIPIVVLDMWSHAYHRDYVIDKKSYAIAMMRELNWKVIEDRVALAERIAGISK